MLTLLTNNPWLGLMAPLLLLAVWLGWRYYRRRPAGAAEDELFEAGDLDEPAYTRRRPLARETPPVLDDLVLPDDVPSLAPEKEKPPGRPRELIVAFFIEALENSSFGGPELLAALEKNGLRHGEMRIFHHYGLDQQKSKPAQPVFSIANMLEPGTFDPAAMDDFSTRGLAMFMRLPGPLSGRVAFELMLNHAHRLAESLHGVLKDETRAPLGSEKIAFLRQGIDEFERERAA